MRRFLYAVAMTAALALAAPVISLVTTPVLAQSSKLLDINSASQAELDALPGIGKAYSAAIIKGRPYKSKDELVRRKILPQKVYDGIKDKIIAHQA